MCPLKRSDSAKKKSLTSVSLRSIFSIRKTPARLAVVFSWPGAAGAVVAAVAEAAVVAAVAVAVVVAAAAVAALRGELAAFAKADGSSITLTDVGFWPGSIMSTRPIHVILVSCDLHLM
jgi:hypothetical protein